MGGGSFAGESVTRGAKLREVPWRSLVSGMEESVESSAKSLGDKTSRRDPRTQKKLAMMRLALLNRMQAKEKEEVNALFLIDSIDLVRRMEESLEHYEHDLEAWRWFLTALDQKLADGGHLSDEDVSEQAARLKHAIAQLKKRLDVE